MNENILVTEKIRARYQMSQDYEIWPEVPLEWPELISNNQFQNMNINSFGLVVP